MRVCASGKGGGASPSPFDPSQDATQEATQNATQPREALNERYKQQLLDVVRRAPEQMGQEGSRWTLASLRDACLWAEGCSLGGLSRLLRRLGIRYKRSRSYIHSPDPLYADKRQAIEELKGWVLAHPDEAVLLYLDEYSAMRQPKNGRAYAEAGVDQALASRSTQSDRAVRVLATLNLASGQVCYCITDKTNIACFVAFWQQLCEQYAGKRIYLVIDNWSMHFHPEVLAPLQLQESPFAFPVSRSWRTLVANGRQPQVGTLPIQYLPLPTYASWLNPIEKLWLRLGEKVLVLHRHANDLPGLRAALRAFLDQFVGESPGLLRAVGLAPHPHPNS